MSRLVNRLVATQVEALGPGRHADGGGLYLAKDDRGRSRWLFLYTRAGRRREMGLGPAGKRGVPLAKARSLAAAAREVLAKGGDPIQARNAEVQAVTIPTFGAVADALVADLSPQWRNQTHRAQWAMTLMHYAAPLRSIPVDAVTTADVLGVLKPIWLTRQETASRVRGRIERVLDAAKAKGFRAGENPARWRGHLDHLLPKRQKLARGHHAAMPFDAVPAFVAELHGRKAVTALGLEFLILTAARSGEVLGATWDEVDLETAIWTVPAKRMKAGREHRVPLCARAVDILISLRRLVDDEASGRAYIFPGAKNGRPLSNMAFQMLMGRMDVDAYTPHGFRSSFRDWAGEVSPFPREIAEAALAHTVGDQTERAYRRGDALDKRRQLMEAWAAYVSPLNAPAEQSQSKAEAQ